MKARRLTLVGAVLAVCVYATAAAGSHTKSGGTFRLGTSSRIDSLNPYVAFNQDAYSTFEYIYPFLIQYDRANHNFAPDFARSWKTTNGGKTWTFTTVSGAKWSDGQPMTAVDAAWTINTDIKYKAGGAANAAGLIAHITRAEAPTPTTLVVHYAAPAGNVLGQFQQFAILPKHIWSQHTGHKGNDLKTFANNAPVVSGGPFTLVKFQKDQIALFQRNDSFYGLKPQVDAFGLQMFSNDDALVAALKNHDIDAIEDVPATAIKTLKSSGFTVTDVPGVDQTDFIINSNPKKTNHRELLDPRVKTALDYAIDRNQIVRVVFLGAARPGASIIPPATGSWYNPAVKPTPFNIAKANQILDALGYKKGSDGIRVANGSKMSYQVIAPTDVHSIPRTFQILQAAFRKIGVQISQKALDSSAAFDAITAPGGKYLDFDFAMWDWVALIDPDFMLSVTTCDQYNGWSDSGFCDKRYDALYSKQQLTPDQTKRRAVVWQMQKYLQQQKPYLWLATEDHVSASASTWAGLVASPQGPFNSLSKASLTSVHQK
ncbi:MAG: ABC transporter substrate-binding protein [Gaiellaceae bacterium]